MRRRPIGYLLWFTVLWFFCLSLPAYANNGINWLVNQAQSDGQYSTSNDLATPFQATAETWRTLSLLGETPTTQPSLNAALDFINAEPFPSTEHLARRLITCTFAHQPVDDLTDELLSRFSVNEGGLGDLLEYDHTVLDTALALEALALTDTVTVPTEVLYPAIDFLLQAFDANTGGWADNDNEISVYTTAIVMRALWHYRHQVSHIPVLNVEPTLDQAQAFLLTQLAQGENETFETALTLLAMIPRLSQLTEIASYLEALQTAQLANGSWENDVYTTALALRALYIVDNPPSLGKLHGIVMDASNNDPLANVAIVATFGENPQQLTTNADGTFEIKGLTTLEGELSFTIAGYVPLSFPLVMEPGETFDLGQVRLRPEAGEVLLPDLMVESIVLEMPLDPQTLILDGQITAEIKNAGTVPTSQQVNVLAFYDVNQDGIYQAEDILLGETVIEQDLASDETLSVAIAVAGQLPFRDAPITVLADSRQLITELKETNNQGTTARVCEVATAFEPVLKWEWSGSSEVLPSYHKQVMSTPVIAPLEDTNSDGEIDALDIPSVIFHSYYAYDDSPRGGYLRAVSGQNGHELWSVSEPKYQTNPSSNVAVADIDQDSKIEIVALKRYGLIAFEHTGVFKWENTEVGEKWGGAISIADLDGDNTPEIIVGNTVLNANGSLRWRGEGYHGENGFINYSISVIADINLDGKAEIIAGASAYSSTGTELWKNKTVGDGFAAIGNFRGDDHPEIVVVSRSKMYLLKHTGEIIWGPVPLSGNGGPPTIADMNGDGIPEIGVAGSSLYIVFTATGAELWRTSIRDKSSGVNGSSTFDFEGDGQAEVVYADESYLRVFRGNDGAVLFKTINLSGTVNELPAIADVDGDNHADIIVCSNSPSGFHSGIRVFQDKNNNWVNTRRIWNQHSYHITNINDDGTVPAVEQNSWQTHNTYRANAVLGPSASGTPDLTAGHFQLLDNGINQPFTLQVRMGNAGLTASSANLPLTFYAGDPANNGTELGTVTLSAFAPGTYQDVQLPNVTLADLTQTLYAVVDPQNTLTECNEDNNQIALTINGSETTLAQLDLNASTDAPAYEPNTSVVIDYTINNQGALTTDFQVEIRLESADGEVIDILQVPKPATLASGDTLPGNVVWNTGTTLAGMYQAHVLVLSTAGEVVTEATPIFTIIADQAEALTLRTTVDKPIYHTTDTVQIANLIRNVTANVLVADATLQISVQDSAGQTVFSREMTLDDLVPGAQRDNLALYALKSVAQGTYTVRAEVLDADNNVLATDSTNYQVQENLAYSLHGQVTVAVPTLYRGETQRCSDTLTNDGTVNLTAQAIRQLVIAVESGQEVLRTETTLDLAVGATQTLARTLDTSELSTGSHACVLQAMIAEQWQTLDFQTFTLQSVLSSECGTVYAIHDQQRTDTQLFTYDLHENSVKPLGPLYPQRDLEGTDIHPNTHQLYASSGEKDALLYLVDGYTGALEPVGATGFDDVVALSFDANGKLWGWAKQHGLLRLNLDTGQGELIVASELPVEGIAWNNAGTLLYGTAIAPSKQNSTLWAYDPQQQTLTLHCDNLPGEVESLESLPDGRLAFGIHNDKQLSFYLYDAVACQITAQTEIVMPFNDIEAIAWPTANCTTQQRALRAFLLVLSAEEVFLGEDGHLRVPLEGQIHLGRLAQAITQGPVPDSGQLHLAAIPDANEDGIDDFLITYPDGQQQVLYYLGVEE